MAGPTPVSALIHAATMVTAGVYLVCRMAPVFALTQAAMFFVALVGALTAVFAATIALVQNDIKKVLAYSTVSQLGMMFLGVGVGAFAAGFYHVVTHAFFKACLFLGAGSVIHALHARIHRTDQARICAGWAGSGGSCRTPTGPSWRACSPSRASRSRPGSSPRTRSSTARGPATSPWRPPTAGSRHRLGYHALARVGSVAPVLARRGRRGADRLLHGPALLRHLLG
jgi:hypothetical protein